MLRLWAREYADGHMIADVVAEDDSDRRRTQKIFSCLDEVCAKLDLQKPIWLDKMVLEFQRTSCTRFYQDSFIEEIPFDYLEIRVIEDD